MTRTIKAVRCLQKPKAKPKSISLRAKTPNTEFSIKFSSEPAFLDSSVRRTKRLLKWGISLIVLIGSAYVAFRFLPSLLPVVVQAAKGFIIKTLK